MAKRKRLLGERIEFRGLDHAPVNELGVVFLFGMLHESLDIHVESIQPGFPDCTAKRRLPGGKWQALRIEFEYQSKSFIEHGHDLAQADVIVCWVHNAPRLDGQVEIIELSKCIEQIKQTDTSGPGGRKTRTPLKAKTPKPLNQWQQFCQQKRAEGYQFNEISRMWKLRKRSVQL